jgi:hypothetical protein
MACNYSNLCGPTSSTTNNNEYVKNGGSAHSTFNFEKNNVYMPYVEVRIENDLYVTGDAGETWEVEKTFCDTPYFIEMEKVDVSTTKSYIQSFEMTVGKSYEGSVVIVTCDYSKVEKLLSITPPETCGWDEYEIGEAGSAVIGHIDIGWLIKSCDGSIKKFTMKEMNNQNSNMYQTEEGYEKLSGPYIYGIFKKVDVSSENGIYKVTMTFVDGFAFNEETKLDKIWGDERMKLSFKDAIIAASKFNCNTRKDDGTQVVSRISFRINLPWTFDTKYGGENGPKSVWNGWRQSLFPFLREISNYLLSVSNKGWWFAYDNGSCGAPSILLVEDRNPSLCFNEKDIVFNGKSITYIANGGDCSPVIKFSPSFNSVTVQNNTKGTDKPSEKIALGAGGPSGLDGKPIEILDCSKKFDAKTGESKITATPKNTNSANGPMATISGIMEVLNFKSPINITKETANAVYNQAKAEAGDGNAMNLFAPVKATLEIHGDPFWANSINLFKYCFIKIIFLNPYCIENKSSGLGCEFLQKPKCNSKFSGIYKVGSAKHSISSGSYVTTLDLFAITMNGDNNNNFGL